MGSQPEKGNVGPHEICIPYPAQGHVNPMLRLAKLLHHKGFHITFVNAECNHKRLLKSRGPDSLNGLPDFQFKTIPNGLPPSDDIDATQDIPTLCESTSKNCLPYFRDLIDNDLNPDPNPPPVSCIVSDGCMSFTLDAAKELGIPEVLFWTPSACGFMVYIHFPEFIKRDLTPLQDASQLTNGYLETDLDWLQGMKNIWLRDVPTFIQTTDPKYLMVSFVTREVTRTPKAATIILNTFDALENKVFSAMKSNERETMGLFSYWRDMDLYPIVVLSSFDFSLLMNVSLVGCISM